MKSTEILGRPELKEGEKHISVNTLCTGIILFSEVPQKERLDEVIGCVENSAYIQRIIGYSLAFIVNDVFPTDTRGVSMIHQGLADHFRTTMEIIERLEFEAREKGFIPLELHLLNSQIVEK